MKKTKIPLPDNLQSLQAQPFVNRARGRFQAKAAEQGVTQIDVYGDIGFWGITAADFRRTLRDAGDITLRINSRGGDVFDGIAIYNDLVDHPGRITVEIPGLAASAASVIAMAGDSISIAESAFMMIHNAWGVVMGNRHELARVVDVLAGIDKALARIYADRTGVGLRAVAEMMDDETWLSGKAAVEQGFADALTGDADEAQARWDLTAFQRVPDALKGNDTDEAHDDWTKREVERALRNAGCPRKQAEAFAARAFARAQGDPDRMSATHEGDPGEELAELVAALKAEHVI